MKKRFTAVLASALCIAFLLAGCGGKTASQSASGTSEQSMAGEGTEISSQTDTAETLQQTGNSQTEAGAGSALEADSSTVGDLTSFSCQTLDGKTITEKDFSGKDVTVINFWSTTCGPCVEEIPQLETLRKSLPDNVQLLLVCIDGSSDAAKQNAQKLIKETGYTGTVAMTGDGDMESISQKIQYIPMTLFFDENGKAIGSSIVGMAQDVKSTYKSEINKLLSAMGKDTI